MSKIEKSKDFIKRLALDKFKEKRHTNISYDDLDVISIEGRGKDDKAYEVFSVRDGDSFRLRLYLTLSNKISSLDEFILRESEVNPVTSVNSHVYVSEGLLERKFVWNEDYAPIKLKPNSGTLYSITLEDGRLLLSEHDGQFLLEAAA